MATCSSDKTIKIHNVNETTNTNTHLADLRGYILASFLLSSFFFLFFMPCFFFFPLFNPPYAHLILSIRRVSCTIEALYITSSHWSSLSCFSFHPFTTLPSHSSSQRQRGVNPTLEWDLPFPRRHSPSFARSFSPSYVVISHEGPVWQVGWAHPKFGVVLASCSYDRKVFVWKETSPNTWEIIYQYSGHELSGRY